MGDIRRIGPRTGTGFKIEDLGINGMLVGGPDGRPLRDDEQGFPTINIEGYQGMGEIAASSNIDNSRTYQWVDNVSVIKGRHALKFGGDIRYHLDEATTNNWPFGQIDVQPRHLGTGRSGVHAGVSRERHSRPRVSRCRTSATGVTASMLRTTGRLPASSL